MNKMIYHKLRISQGILEIAKSKKAAGFFMIIFLVFVIFVISFGVKVFLGEKGEQNIIKEIGDPQISLMRTYQKAELDLFNLDQAVKYSTYNTIKGFSNNGGLDEICSNRWKFNSDCEPNLEEDFLALFNNYMSEFGYDVKEVRLEDNVLKGNLDDFVYEGFSRKVSYSYSIKADFKQELAIDIIKLENLKQDIETCLRDKKEIGECTTEGYEKEENLIKFNIESDKKIMVFTDQIEFKEQDFIFELNLDDTGIETNIF